MTQTDELVEDLAHYGIKGMKWGVRRTRAQIDADSADAAAKKTTQAKISKNRGSTDPLSNAELRALNERLQLEENYAKLMGKTGDRSQTKGQKAAKAGSKFAKELVVDSGKQVLKNVVTTQSQKALNNKIEEAIKKKQGE